MRKVQGTMTSRSLQVWLIGVNAKGPRDDDRFAVCGSLQVLLIGVNAKGPRDDDRSAACGSLEDWLLGVNAKYPRDGDWSAVCGSLRVESMRKVQGTMTGLPSVHQSTSGL